MKRLLFTLSLLIGLPVTSFALPIGNPADPMLYHRGFIADQCDPSCCSWADSFSLRFGYYGDFIFNRHAKRTTSHDIDDLEMNTNAALIVLNWCEKVDLFGLIGATKASVHSTAINIVDPFTTHVRFDLDYAPDFSYGLGLRAVVWDWNCFALGVEGQYFFTHMKFDRFTLAERTTQYIDHDSAIYREAQAGVALSYSICVCDDVEIVPYIGAKWSRLWNDHGDILLSGLRLSDYENNKNWGYAVGVTLVDCSMASLSVEGRFADEKAVSVNGQIRF